MKKILLIFIIGCSLSSYGAQPNVYERKLLYELLEQRRKKFDAYANSIEQNSGIFGNKTKKDMHRSNEVLTEIVKTDNRIIGVLNRAVDFKNYEKVEMSYEAKQDNEQLTNLLQATDTLSKQVEAWKSHNSHLKRKVRNLKITNWLFGGAAFLMIIMYLKVRKKRVVS